MGVLDDCKKVVKESLKALGGLDVIVSNAVSFSFNFQIARSFKARLGISKLRVDGLVFRDGRSSATLEICMP